MIRALLFDLDDTLYGYAPSNAAGLSAAHGVIDDALGVPIARFQEAHDRARGMFAERLRGQAASHNRMLFFKQMILELGGPGRSALAVALFDIYWRAFFDAMQAAPDAVSVLEQLAAEFKLAVVSNHTTDIQLRKLDRLGLDPFFSAIVTSEEVGVEKPSPVIYRHALLLLGATAAEAVMIGDDPERDIAGARAVGIRTIRTAEFEDRETGDVGPDRVIERLNELPSVLSALRLVRPG